MTGALVAVAVAFFAVATWKRWPVAIVVAALPAPASTALRYRSSCRRTRCSASRNFYGALRVKESGTGSERRRDLLHGVILHGDQYPGDAAHVASRRPTTARARASRSRCGSCAPTTRRSTSR